MLSFVGEGSEILLKDTLVWISITPQAEVMDGRTAGLVVSLAFGDRAGDSLCVWGGEMPHHALVCASLPWQGAGWIHGAAASFR